jgi:hypothetical protein
LEIASAEVSVCLQISDHGFDGGSAPEFAFDLANADGSFYANLRGRVRDINYVQTFLQAELMIPDGRLFKPTS